MLKHALLTIRLDSGRWLVVSSHLCSLRLQTIRRLAARPHSIPTVNVKHRLSRCKENFNMNVTVKHLSVIALRRGGLTRESVEYFAYSSNQTQLGRDESNSFPILCMLTRHASSTFQQCRDRVNDKSSGSSSSNAIDRHHASIVYIHVYSQRKERMYITNKGDQ